MPTARVSLAVRISDDSDRGAVSTDWRERPSLPQDSRSPEQYIFGSSGDLANVRALNASRISPPSLFEAQLEDRLGKREVDRLHTTFIRAAASVPFTPMDQWSSKFAFEWPASSIVKIAAELGDEPTSGASRVVAPVVASALALAALRVFV